MSRHPVAIARGADIDRNAVVGFDRPLTTFFVQAFPDAEEEGFAVWLGYRLAEFPTLSSLLLVIDKG
jgi:hypothetical protein